MANSFELVSQLVSSLKQRRLDDWATKFEVAMAGSTGTEIQMGLRWEAHHFLKSSASSDEQLRTLAEGIYADADRSLRQVDMRWKNPRQA